MQNQSRQLNAPIESGPRKSIERVPDYPVREYIGAMAQELALMARWDGDEALAVMLEAAMDRASATPERPAIERGAERARPA